MIHKETKIELDVKLEHLDFWRYYVDAYLNIGTLFYIFFGLGLFGFTLLSGFLESSFNLNLLVKFTILSFCFSILFTLLLICVFAEQSAEFSDDAKYIISNKKFEIITEEFRLEIEWNYFNKIRETKSYFFLDAKNRQKIMIPKTDFADDEQIQDFKNLLYTKFG
ncbi:MAG: YcxB family protein, partial [Pyrinomonadaceae bacterium]